MNRRDWVFAVSALAFAGLTSAQAAEKSITLEPFAELHSDLPALFELVNSDSHSLHISAEPHVLKRIGVQVQDGVLTVRATGSFQTQQAIRLQVSTPALNAVSMGGAASFSAAKMPASRFSLTGKDSASITINKLNVEQLISDLAGSSTVSLNGNAGSQQITVRESASLEAKDLRSQSAVVEVSGAGDAVVNVESQLRVDVSDAGSVSYQGSPRLEQSVKDAGSVDKI